MRCSCVLTFLVTLTMGSGVFASDKDIQQMTAVVDQYTSLPKGVVFEGAAQGIEALDTLDYNKKKNEFIINGSAKYKNPVSRKELAQIIRSLQKEPNFGVTLRDGEPRSYGKIDINAPMMKALVDTDILVGAIVFGIAYHYENMKLPGNYVPKHADNRTIVCVAFTRMIDFQFQKKNDEYTSAGCTLDIQVIPLAEKKSDLGGYMPDMDRLKDYKVEATDQENINQIKSRQMEYFKIPCIADTVKAGEAVAFARYLLDSKKVDVNAMVKELE